MTVEELLTSIEDLITSQNVELVAIAAALDDIAEWEFEGDYNAGRAIFSVKAGPPEPP